jgi:hypothetical protein
MRSAASTNSSFIVENAGGPTELTRLRSAWAILDVLRRLLFGRRPWYLSDSISFHRCPCRWARGDRHQPSCPSCSGP